MKNITLAIKEDVLNAGKSCMTAKCFLDTNILLYAASRKPADLAKKKTAMKIIEREKFGISAQVLQEFYTAATRKAEFSLSPEKALEWIANLDEFPCAAVDAALVKTAAAISARYRISYWDGAIIAAAEALGAPIVYTEDLNHGQCYGEVKVINPFRDTTPQSAFHKNEKTRL